MLFIPSVEGDINFTILVTGTMLPITTNFWPFVLSICVIVSTNIIMLGARYSKPRKRNLTDKQSLLANLMFC
jgi:hypothetical protein